MKKLAAILSIVIIGTTIFTSCGDSQSSEVKSTDIENTQIESNMIQNGDDQEADNETAWEDPESEETEAENEEPEVEESASDGYMTNYNICTQDEYEQTLFGQPISTDRNGEIRMGIKCTHDSYAELTIYEAQDGKYNSIFSCPALIGKNGPGKHAEGDTKTPLGTWEVGNAYGIKEDPGSLLPYTQVTEDDYWCATGSNSTKYNQLIKKSEYPDNDFSEDEHLIDYPIRYAYFLDLGYNKACAPYAGNAIFLHVWKEPDYPTGGCVAVSEESMVQILQTLPVGATVTIY